MTETLESRSAKARARIVAKAKAGHPILRRVFGGVPHIALDNGPGRCSSSFIPEPKGV